jgi:hypothetical protein
MLRETRASIVQPLAAEPVSKPIRLGRIHDKRRISLRYRAARAIIIADYASRSRPRAAMRHVTAGSNGRCAMLRT